MVDSCKSCCACKKDEEQYCASGSVFTYGGVTKYGRAGPNGVSPLFFVFRRWFSKLFTCAFSELFACASACLMERTETSVANVLLMCC
jgi:hypothetical protein